MKRLLRKLILFALLILAAGAIYAYQNPETLSHLKPTQSEEPYIPKTQKNSDIIFKTKNTAESILGTTTKKISQTAQNTVKKLADEQEEALINQTVQNLSRQVKDLPEKQVEKIKYEFCQDVISKYEEKHQEDQSQ